MQVRGMKDKVPVSSLADKSSSSKFANWPNSAGMGPEVYKTQSIHTKNKSRDRTGTKGHVECKPIPLYRMQLRGKRDGVPVSLFVNKFSFANKCSCCKFVNWPNSAGMGPGVYKTQQKHTKTSHTIVLVRKGCKHMTRVTWS